MAPSNNNLKYKHAHKYSYGNCTYCGKNLPKSTSGDYRMKKYGLDRYVDLTAKALEKSEEYREKRKKYD